MIIIMDYRLGKFNPKDLSYEFVFSNGSYVELDLANDYPNYRLPFSNLGSKQWHFTIIESINEDKIGNIELFDYCKLRKIGTLIKEFRRNDNLYRKSTQTELDKYLFKTDPNCDNSRVYTKLLEIYNKNIEELAEQERVKKLEKQRQEQYNNDNLRVQITYV